MEKIAASISNWRGSEKRALEERLTDVVVGMLKLASAARADDLKQQERQRNVQAALDEQKRLREALANEKAKVQLLLDQAARWRESQSVRHFVEEARKRSSVCELGFEDDERAQWIAWATEQADRLDPFSPSPPSILDEADRIEHMCDGLRGCR